MDAIDGTRCHLGVASLYHSLSKFLAQRVIRRSSNEYHTDLPLWSRLLRMGNGWKAQRANQCDRASEPADELASSHRIALSSLQQ